MHALIETLLYVLDLYKWIVIAAVVASWLTAYGVINRQNRVAMSVVDILDRLTEPALRPIRRVMPRLGGLDISPVILLIIIFFLERLIEDDIIPALFRSTY
jgi:YggT family protein